MVETLIRENEHEGARSPRPNRDPNGSRLIAAVASGDLVELRSLLEHGMAPDTTLLGRTAVMWAVLQGQWDALSVLLEAGADPRIPTSSGITPLAVARSLGCLRSVQLLSPDPQKE